MNKYIVTVTYRRDSALVSYNSERFVVEASSAPLALAVAQAKYTQANGYLHPTFIVSDEPPPAPTIHDMAFPAKDYGEPEATKEDDAEPEGQEPTHA